MSDDDDIILADLDDDDLVAQMFDDHTSRRSRKMTFFLFLLHVDFFAHRGGRVERMAMYSGGSDRPISPGVG